MKYRIITDGSWFKVQQRKFYFFWSTIQEPDHFENKSGGCDKLFKSEKEAQQFINVIRPRPITVVTKNSVKVTLSPEELLEQEYSENVNDIIKNTNFK